MAYLIINALALIATAVLIEVALVAALGSASEHGDHVAIEYTVIGMAVVYAIAVLYYK